jgi:hypothetical protein
MKNIRLARMASLVCFAGGIIQVVYGLFAIPFGPYSLHAYGWDEVLWALAIVGEIGAVIGLLALDVARPRWLAGIGGALAILGQLIRIVVSALIVLRPPWDSTAPIIVSILLMLLGFALLGTATLLGKQLIGWRAWTPLLIPVIGLMIAMVFSINLYIHFILLGLWGLPWLLVGFVVFTQAGKQV